MFTARQVKQLIAEGEGHRLDFKRDLSEETFQDLSKDCAAFANSEGGTILVGVTNEKDPIGVKPDSGVIARIYQEATYCIPPVAISITETNLNKIKILVIEIPKSSYIHCDKKRRFPQRLGDKTDFMETQMILSLARSRNLIGENPLLASNRVWTSPPRKKPTKDDVKLVSLLPHPNHLIRLAALQDLYSRAPRYDIERLPGFWRAIQKRFGDDNPEVRRWTLMLLVMFVSQFQSPKSRIAPSQQLVRKIARLALEDSDSSVRSSAFELMCWIGRPEFLEPITRILVTTPKESYQTLNTQYNLSHLTKRRMWHGLKAKLYQELEGAQDKEVQSRLLDLLQTMRSVTPY